MMASLYCVELRTPRFDEMLTWYRDTVGLDALLRVAEDRFALLGCTAGRLALIGRDTTPPPSDRWSLAFEVQDLASAHDRLVTAGASVEGPRKTSEGYEEVLTTDPDGNRVRLFAWP